MQPNINGLKIKISNTPKTLISTFSWDICARLTAYSNKGKAQYWRIQKTYDAASKEMFVFPIKISSEVSISSPLSSWKRVQYTITRDQGDRCRIPIPPIFTTSETFTKLICNFRRNVRLCWAVYWLQHRLRERRFSHTDDADSTDRDVIVFENHQYWLQVCYCFPLERKEKKYPSKLLETENGKFNKRELVDTKNGYKDPRASWFWIKRPGI